MPKLTQVFPKAHTGTNVECYTAVHAVWWKLVSANDHCGRNKMSTHGGQSESCTVQDKPSYYNPLGENKAKRGCYCLAYEANLETEVLCLGRFWARKWLIDCKGSTTWAGTKSCRNSEWSCENAFRGCIEENATSLFFIIIVKSNWFVSWYWNAKRNETHLKLNLENPLISNKHLRSSSTVF